MSDNDLNLFQRLTRRWESVHPYNAAQVMRISGRIGVSDATEFWGQSLRALGLGRVRVSEDNRFRHVCLNGELSRYPVRELPASTRLDDHLTAELNHPFADPNEPPFRPFMVQHENDFHLGVVYQHWVADSVSIRAVLREWFTRAFDPAASLPIPLRHARSGYWDLFAARSAFRLDEAMMAAVRSHMRHRRVRKVQANGAADYPVRVTFHEAPVGLIEHLKTFSRSQRVKIHDVLLAAMAEMCDRFVPAQVRRNRPDLSVGSIVDLRNHSGVDLSNLFGLFLGFTNVVCRPQDLREWPRLLQSIAAQHRKHKRNGLPQASTVWMLAAMAVDRFVPNHELYHFYRKELPMLGGLSNVNLNDTWAARYHPQVLKEYVRVSPTGPLVPLVFSTTTLGSRFNFAVTCRDKLLPPETVCAMVRAFLDRLGTLCAECEQLPAVDNFALK